MKWIFISAALLSVLVPARPVQAQSRPERPYRGLFGGGIGPTSQLLTATASVGAGWDNNLAADALGLAAESSDVNRRFEGGLSTASAGLAYSLNRQRVDLGASAGTSLRYYPSQTTEFVRRSYGNVGTSARLGAGFSTRAQATYQPYSLLSLLPSLSEPLLDDPLLANEDFPTSAQQYLEYSAGLDFTKGLSSRTTFSAMYDYQGSEPLENIERFRVHRAGVRFNRAIGRGVSLQLGYGYAKVRYGDRESPGASHIIDAGVNYARTLSFSRRTTLSFTTGTTTTRTATDNKLQFHATGAARLNHEIGRTWSAAVSYDRGLQFNQTWQEPVFTDAVVAEVTGLLNRRVQFDFTARALRGRQLYVEEDSLESYGAITGITVGLTRYLSAGVNGTYYSHQFGRGVAPPPGLVHDFDRRSVRAFVGLWAPLFQRSRIP